MRHSTSMSYSIGSYVKLAPELVGADAAPWPYEYIEVTSRRSCAGVWYIKAINFYNENRV